MYPIRALSEIITAYTGSSTTKSIASSTTGKLLVQRVEKGIDASTLGVLMFEMRVK